MMYGQQKQTDFGLLEGVAKDEALTQAHGGSNGQLRVCGLVSSESHLPVVRRSIISAFIMRLANTGHSTAQHAHAQRTLQGGREGKCVG